VYKKCVVLVPSPSFSCCLHLTVINYENVSTFAEVIVKSQVAYCDSFPTAVRCIQFEGVFLGVVIVIVVLVAVVVVVVVVIVVVVIVVIVVVVNVSGNCSV